MGLDVWLDGESLLVTLTLTEDTEALSGVKVSGVNGDLSCSQSTKSTDELGPIEGDIDVNWWSNWLSWACWEGIDHLRNLLAEEV